MLSDTTVPNFVTLLTTENSISLLEQLDKLIDRKSHPLIKSFLNQPLALNQSIYSNTVDIKGCEQTATNWLIDLFNTLFAEKNVQLARGDNEPEYFPATITGPARIEFAHGFFASALHEISHWCVAGFKRRQLSDFGYWYAADGRSQTEQYAFERVEIKPQALECLFTLACHRPFQVSQDNLFATFDTSDSSFAQDVYNQVQCYIAKPHNLPFDAQILLAALLTFYLSNH